MLSGDRRGPSTRRGMIVLGKIPTVPKPINLPSQRLENRGLDPNVEIVPRGSMSWGSAGRSPPTGSNAWPNAGQSSSPPVSMGAWSGVAKPATITRSNSSVGHFPGNSSRPSSAGGGTRPSSAGSIRRNQEQSMHANAWGMPVSRPSSASSVSGQDQSELIVERPHSAEARPGSLQSSNLSRFADSTNESTVAPVQAWGSSGSSSKMHMDGLQPARFILTPVDFPSLGSKKNPDLRPHQTNALSGNPVSADSSFSMEKERQSPPSSEDMPPTPVGSYGVPAKGMADTWHRDNHAFSGPPPQDGHWHQNASHIQGYNVIPHLPESWRREIGHGVPPVASPVEHTWRRGVPPVGLPGPGRFLHDPFMHQRFGPRPLTYGRGPPGPGDFSRRRDIYSNAVPSMRQTGPRPGQQGLPLGQGMHPGPVLYEGYYGLPGDPSYGNMDETEMMLGVVSPGMHGSFPHQPWPPHDHFSRHGPRHRPMHSGRASDYSDFKEHDKDSCSEISHREVEKNTDSWGTKETGKIKDGSISVAVHAAGQGGSVIRVPADDSALGVQKHKTSGTPDGHHERGVAGSNVDEPMNFSKPSVSPSLQDLDVSGRLTEGIVTTQKILHCQPSRRDSVECPLIIKGKEHAEESMESQGKVTLQLLRSATSGSCDFPNKEVNTEGDGKEKDSLKDVTVCIGKEAAGIKNKKTIKDFPNEGVVKESGCELTLNERAEDREAVNLVKDSCCDKEAYSSDRVEGNIFANSLLKASQQIVLATSGRAFSVASLSSTIPYPGVESSISVAETTLPIVESNVVVVQGGKSGSHISEFEVPKDSGHLKHSGESNPNSFHIGGVAVEHGHVGSVKGSSGIHEPLRKEDHKQKHRFNIHEGEKEWRPKVPTGQLRMEATKFTVNSGMHSCKANSAPAVTVITETKNSGGRGGAEFENAQQLDDAQQFDSYDYEAQRARLKEIALQRAIQLQKEEEERTREQRAKAFAKLEELNRRTSTTLNAGEACLVKESIKDLVREPASENNYESGSQQQSGLVDTMSTTRRMEGNQSNEKNEYRKCVRDCKHTSGGDDLQSKGGIEEQEEISEDKVNGSFNEPGNGPILISSSPRQLAGSHTSLEPSINQPQGQQHLRSRSHHVQQRNKHAASVPKQQSDKLDSGLYPQASIVDNVEVAENFTEEIDTGHQKAVDAYPISTAELGSDTAAGSGNTEGQGNPRRRKNNRIWKNKYRPTGSSTIMEPEQATVLSDSSSGDLFKDGKHVKDVTGETPVSELTLDDGPAKLAAVPTAVVKFDFPVSSIGKEIALGGVHEGNDTDAGTLRPNDDIPNRREKHKSQLVQRPFRERGLQETRSDKTVSNEGMVWARVRTHSNQSELGFESRTNSIEGLQETKCRTEELVSQNYHGRRVDLERYTPKSASKLQEPQTHIQHQLPRHSQDNSFEEASETCIEDASTPRLHLLQNESVTEPKLGNENKTIEISKSGRFHTSWRQRNIGESSSIKVSEVTRGGGSQTSLPSQTEPKQKRLELQTLVSSSEQKSRAAGSDFRVPSAQQTKSEIQSIHEMDRQNLQEHFSQDDYRKKVHIVKDNASSSQLGRLSLSKQVKQNTQHERVYGELLSNTDDVTFQHSESSKHDSVSISYENEGRNCQEREGYHRSCSAGSHNPSRQGILDGKEHFSCNTLRQSRHTVPSACQPRTSQTVVNSEQELTGKVQQLSTKSSKSQLEGQGCSTKEQNKVLHFSPSRQDTKPHALSEDGSDAVRNKRIIHEQRRNEQWNKLQGFSDPEREHLYERGHMSIPLQRRQGSGHFQWQQTAPGNLQTAQKASEQSRGPETSKLHASSGEIHKQTQFQYQAVAQSGQALKQHLRQSITLPATGVKPELAQSYEQQNKHRVGQKDNVYGRSRDNIPSRHGRLNGHVSGGRGVDMERREKQSKQRLAVDAPVDAASDQVVG